METYYVASIEVRLPEGTPLTCASCPRSFYRNNFVESCICGVTGENVMEYYGRKTLSPNCKLTAKICAARPQIGYCKTKTWQCPILRKTRKPLGTYPPYFCPAFNVYRSVTDKEEVLRVEGCGVTQTYLNLCDT